jgi:copper homeostasis protein
MIRPRAGDFLYSEAEFDTMRRDVEIAVEMGAHGIMCGILKPNGDLDVERMRILIERAPGVDFTLHRAFDFSNDPFKALKDAVELGCNRILTLGQERDAAFDRKTLRKLISEAKGKIRFVIALGADFNTKSELPKVVEEIGAAEYHIVNGYRNRQSKMNTVREKGGNDDYLKDAMSVVEYLSEDAVCECRNILDALPYSNE